MGAWGSGSFENDTAMDWAASVQSIADVREPFDRLKAATDASEDPEALMLDSDFACELVAAAETVAMMMGRRSRDFPEELQQRLANAGEPDGVLFHQARNAVCHVMRTSELAELWEEAAEESGVNEWHVEITGLIDRLNPDIEVIPWEPEDIASKVAAPVGTCAFCDGPIQQEELFGVSLYDASNMNSIGKGFWLHLACLNSRLHHKHAILDFKFDPDNMPDLDKL